MALEVETVFFDWGGVIADDSGDRFLDSLEQNVGINSPEQLQIFRALMHKSMKGEVSEEAFFGSIRQSFGDIATARVRESLEQWSGLKANKDMLDLVKYTKSKGIRTAILSNIIEPTYNTINATGQYDDFDFVVASCRVGYAKPEKEIYEIALHMLNTSAEKSIFIDDKEKNLTPARKLGFTIILAQSAKQTIDDLKLILQG